MPKIKIDSSKGLNQFSGEGYVLTPATLSAPAPAAAGSTNTLTQAAMTIVSNVNNGADRVYLPSPTDCDLGQVIRLIAAEAFELSSKGDGTTETSINGTNVTDAAGAVAAELAVSAGTVLDCIKTGDNAWTVVVQASAGTPDAV